MSRPAPQGEYPVAANVCVTLGGGRWPQGSPRGNGAAQRTQREGTVPGFALVTERGGVGSDALLDQLVRDPPSPPPAPCLLPITPSFLWLPGQPRVLCGPDLPRCRGYRRNFLEGQQEGLIAPTPPMGNSV